ncbi:hypothetical protein Pla123a_37450 [Posidoniimonas polymericola]|uniref:3-keto-alpha-glucoside-1,2-lyase/3-keto-2-hydroxy-glucal hydratase domain-containing protein n=1 Tax=Posidoniimonas polymericola TaxID=2528002 RepID=A0A5C5YGV9_9BACT|nr:DUF1080 domain-containing protein [Posidoniimonas polymericola]TWT73851.1 hypothetical protein Pla123a_37450 [Posidoniimonas polymericola]
MNRFVSICMLPLFALAAVAAHASEYLPGIEWPEPPVVTPGEKNSDPPSDALVLFDGTSKSAFDNADNWKVEDGVLIAGQGALVTREKFGDCQLHIEWSAAVPVKGNGQGRSNSGVYFMSQAEGVGYEVQILDSYQNPTYFDGQAGAIYKQQPPMVNAMRPPGEWNAYDVIWTAPRFNADGSLNSPAYMTVIHNGVLLQNHTELAGKSAWDTPPAYTAHPDRLPLRLQDHGNPVRFRNIWIRDYKKLEGKQVAEPRFR